LLKNQQLVPTSYNEIDARYQFKFVPHKAINNIANLYVVTCSNRALKSKPLTHRCTLKSQQSFYLDNPKEHFEIEDFSNVETALKAYRLLSKFDLNDIPDEKAQYWIRVSRAKAVEVDGDNIIFNFRSECCGISLEFKFVYDQQKMIFVKVKTDYCY